VYRSMVRTEWLSGDSTGASDVLQEDVVPFDGNGDHSYEALLRRTGARYVAPRCEMYGATHVSQKFNEGSSVNAALSLSGLQVTS